MTLIVRADANTWMGTGHLMRCLALAQGWKDAGGQVVFVTACSNERLLRRLYDENFPVHRIERLHPDARDWQCTRRHLPAHSRAWVVLDGHHFDSGYQERLTGTGHHLIVIDDAGSLPRYHADLIINQNIHAPDLVYPCEPHAGLLLGTRYVLLRREFSRWPRRDPQIVGRTRRVLVTFGGSDRHNVTLKVVRALGQVKSKGLEAIVVAGAENPHYGTLQSALRDSPISIRLESDVSDMPALMAWADIAVSAAGSTAWELAYMGVPSVLLILAENQLPAAERLGDAGVIVNLGPHEDASSGEIAEAVTQLLESSGLRARMSRLGRQLVDGRGVQRVLRHVRRLTASMVGNAR